MASVSRGREQLRDYIANTIGRLQQSPSMDPATFKNKIMPSVVAGIQQLSSSAPEDFKQELTALLTTAGALPNYEADALVFQQTLQKILVTLMSDEESVHASFKMSEPDALAESAVQFEKPESTAVIQPSGSSKGTQRGQMLFHDYVKITLSKLKDPARKGPKMSDSEFASNVLPQILNSLQDLSSQAPADVRLTLARILAGAHLLPYLPVGMDPRKRHLANYPENGGVGLTQPRVQDALAQINSLICQVIQGNHEVQRIGLTSPIEIEVVTLGGSRVVNILLESGTSVSLLRSILSVFLDCPGDTLAFVHSDHELDEEEVLTSDCQLTKVSRDATCLEGIYAAYSCDLLFLLPNSQTAAWWCDDYWQPARDEEHELNRPLRSHAACKACVAQVSNNVLSRESFGDEHDPKRGSWTVVNNGCVKVVTGTAYDPYMDNLYKFKFDVKYDKEFSEGISPIVLDGVRHHQFSYSNGGQALGEPETNRFYLMSSLPKTPA